MDPFETLGIAPSFDLDLPAVERRVRDLSRVLHPDRNLGESASARRASLGKAVEVNEAWRIVRDPLRRAEALLRRAGVTVAEGQEPRPSGAFLMDVMERREALAEARGARDAARVAAMAAEVRALWDRALGSLSAALTALGAEPARAPELVGLLGELRYYARFLEEVSAIDDELSGLS